ncbi:MAG: Mth938-like domain-containing protein, partial [Plesiomonas sp.]
AYQPEVVLLGTGKTIRFPHPKLYQALAAAHIGLDVMDTGAVCRTFNILTSENRKVVALIVHD